MSEDAPAKKRISVVLNSQDYTRLTHLAEASGRTRPGYLRWILHRHFKALDQPGAHPAVPNP